VDFTVILIISLLFALILINRFLDKRNRKRRADYYRNEYNKYLLSEDWKRKRYLVLKRDNWRCVYCGQPATQVHHKKYSKRNLGKEPLIWLVSVCKPCHETIHNKRIHPDLHDSEIRWNYGFDSNTVRFRDKTQKLKAE